MQKTCTTFNTYTHFRLLEIGRHYYVVRLADDIDIITEHCEKQLMLYV